MPFLRWYNGRWATETVESILRAFFTKPSSGAKVVLFGEYHQQPAVISGFVDLLKAASRNESVQNHKKFVVWEHFSLRDKSALELFNDGGSFDDLQQEYANNSEEGFDLHFYREPLEKGRELGYQHVAGFPRRSLASTVAREGMAALSQPELQGTVKNGFPSASEAFLRHFCWLITGQEELIDKERQQKIRKMALAQAIKDEVFAQAIANITTREGTDAVIIGICGKGHCEYGLGVPERLQAAMHRRGSAASDILTVIAQSEEDDSDYAIADTVLKFRWDESR